MQINTTIKLISAVLISSVLTACGGAGSSSVAGAGGGGGGGLRIGIGSGASFVPTKMQIANSSALFEGQTTTITVNIVDNQGTAIDTPVNIQFSSTCINNGTSSITGGSTITSVGGTGIAEYKAGTCLGDDTVYAKISSSSDGTAVGVISGINQKRIGTGTGTSFVAGQLVVSTGTNVLYTGDITSISANIVDIKGNPVTQDVSVHFDSPCISDGSSIITGGSQDVLTINGTAKIDYKVGTCFINDAVTASVKNGSDAVSASTTISVDSRHIGYGVGNAFEEGKLDVGIGDSTLSPGGNTNLTVYIVDSSGSPISDSMDVTFSSPCISTGNATITGGNVVTAVKGKAVATYTSTGCAGINGKDDIKATTTFRNNLLAATASINVKTDTAQTITFIDAKPILINLKGTGGLETSVVRFQVTGQAGNPIKGICVTFAPSTTVGGLALVPSSCNPAGTETYGATSDANGYVSTTVQAGTVSTSVSVVATTPNGISTQSNALAVTTGIPDQNSMSISLSDLAPVSWRHDGVTSDVIIRMADAFNNPVPNNTTVAFTTSGGSIVGSCPTQNGGTCTVKWTSQEPRPHLKGSTNWSFGYDTNNNFVLFCSNGANECRDGRVKILASAIGNESFIDGNGNGLYDDIDSDIFVNSNGIYNSSTKNTPVTNTASCSPSYPTSFAAQINNISKSCDDLREAYVDKNFSYDKDNTEEFIDFNQNGIFDPLPNGKYDGALCSGKAKANGDCTTNTVTVRADINLVMSDEHPYLINAELPIYSSTSKSYVGWNGHISAGLDSSAGASLLLADTNGNGMPAGTAISIDSTNLTNATATIGPTPLASSQEPSVLSLVLTTNKTNPAKGSFDIKISAAGLITVITISVN